MPDEQHTSERSGGGETPPASQDGSATPSFESWIGSQDEAVKGLIDGHVKGLKSALDSERAQRGDLARQLRDVTAKAEKGSELEKALTEVSAQLEVTERRASFYEEAGRPEIGCSNPRLAYLAAVEGDLIDKRGRTDWNALKASAPELFRRSGAAGSADGGAGASKAPAADMNQFIRRAAGR